jgi:hypothetical protein
MGPAYLLSGSVRIQGVSKLTVAFGPSKDEIYSEQWRGIINDVTQWETTAAVVNLILGY